MVQVMSLITCHVIVVNVLMGYNCVLDTDPDSDITCAIACNVMYFS